MASKITIRTAHNVNCNSVLRTLSFYSATFKVDIGDNLSFIFTIPYYLNKPRYKSIERALQINPNYRQKVENDGNLTFTLIQTL